jgi:hypothetical protein
MILALDTVVLLMPHNISRVRAYITVFSDATVYISKSELSTIHDYKTNEGFPIKLYGVHEIKGYTGPIYAVSDTADADVRVIEY